MPQADGCRCFCALFPDPPSGAACTTEGSQHPGSQPERLRARLAITATKAAFASAPSASSAVVTQAGRIGYQPTTSEPPVAPQTLLTVLTNTYPNDPASGPASPSSPSNRRRPVGKSVPGPSCVLRYGQQRLL